MGPGASASAGKLAAEMWHGQGGLREGWTPAAALCARIFAPLFQAVKSVTRKKTMSRRHTSVKDRCRHKIHFP